MYIGKAVGFRIKQLRRQMNMTQFQLAEKLCYANERQVQRIENGEVTCPTDRLIEIADILNVLTDYILFGKEKCFYIELGEWKMLQDVSKELVIIFFE